MTSFGHSMIGLPCLESGLAIMVLPTHLERQFMQGLRGRGWVKRSKLPEATATVANLLHKGWLEERGEGCNLELRVTDEGIAAKTATIPPWKSKPTTVW
jgi:hypothetical protein